MPSCASVPAAEHIAETHLQRKFPRVLAVSWRVVAIAIAICVSACSQDPKAVYEAVAQGDLGKVKRLVEGGAPLDWTPEDGFGALHKALEDGRTDIAAYLVEKGADVKAKGVNGITPLHIVADASLAGRIIEKGAGLEAWSDTVGTPLNAAVLGGLADVAETLIANGAKVDARDAQRSTPLHHASGRGDLNSVQLLISKGADVNAANDPGFRPLHWAAANGHLEVVALLLSHGARPDVVGAKGRSPLDMAIVGEHMEVAELLRKAR